MRLPTAGKIHVKDCTTNPTECGVLDPNTLQCCLPPADDGKWVFPAGTVMVKNFMFPDASRPSGYKLVETRLFVRMDHVVQVQGVNTEWVGYGYQWDDAQTDATIIGSLVDGSDIGVSAMFQVMPTVGAATQPIKWDYPSRIDCLTCHTSTTPTTIPTGGYTIGPETIQMNRVATGDTMNQIDKFAALGMFETAPGKPYKAALVAPYPDNRDRPRQQRRSISGRARTCTRTVPSAIARTANGVGSTFATTCRSRARPCAMPCRQRRPGRARSNASHAKGLDALRHVAAYARSER